MITDARFTVDPPLRQLGDWASEWMAVAKSCPLCRSPLRKTYLCHYVAPFLYALTCACGYSEVGADEVRDAPVVGTKSVSGRTLLAFETKTEVPHEV